MPGEVSLPAGGAGTEKLGAAALQAMPDAVLVVLREGRILLRNLAARELIGEAEELAGLVPDADGAARFRTYLSRCAGSRGPLPGGVALRGADGAVTRYRCLAGLLEPARNGAPAQLLLRLTRAGDERFTALTARLRDMDDEVRRRRRTQSLLEEALRDRELLLRELHHRVKNNIHMLGSMLSAARREAGGRATDAVLADAGRRLAAVGVVHQMLYAGESLRGVPGDAFAERVGTACMEALGAVERLRIAAEPVEVPNDAAVPLALILTELLANAQKHALRPDARPGEVRVSLTAMPEAGIELAVEDEGPGFAPPPAERRASGLGLVRGLARQIGGAFSVTAAAGGGARCAVRFRAAAPLPAPLAGVEA
ncbi:MAG TPA: histidine kinase dimerization/phosphoacceptor domain -containing protein [Crenalkalicoccus sp.]|nr:histidine kinase dimerization/phosphoacceptor domain -containing protein [Crenalkalicoccus sp.]